MFMQGSAGLARRRARSAPLDGHIELVSKAPLGGDHGIRGSTRTQLASQPRDANINASVKHIFEDPGRLDQILTRQRTLR